jgi:hypothetical protein
MQKHISRQLRCGTALHGARAHGLPDRVNPGADRTGDFKRAATRRRPRSSVLLETRRIPFCAKNAGKCRTKPGLKVDYGYVRSFLCCGDRKQKHLFRTKEAFLPPLLRSLSAV